MGSADQSPAISPLAAGERLVALDLIRGIAVLGILLANITAMAHPDLAYFWPGALPGGGNAADGWVWLAQFVLIDGKMRALFTVLFGAGLVLFVERLGEERNAMAVQARRLGWLLLFGLAHFYLLFGGDILFTYACAGLIALALVQMAARRAILLGLIWLVIAGLLQTLSYLTPLLTGAEPYGWAEMLADAEAQRPVLAGDSLLRIVAWRLEARSADLGGLFAWSFFETIPLILLGMGLFRLGLFERAAGQADGRVDWARPLIGRLAWAGVVLGAGLNLASGLWVQQRGFAPDALMFVYFGSATLTNLPLVLGGTVLVARWATLPHEGWLAERLSQAGRMAFTNYLGMSLVMAVIFQGWAGGLYGTLHRAELLLVVLLGWAIMLKASHLWLSRFRYGPLEWLWRCLTYGRLFPNRLVPDQGIN